MASYSVQAIGEPPYSKNRATSGTTADAVTVIGEPVDMVEILNRSTANYIGVNPNGATAVQSNTSTSDGTIYIAPGGAIAFYIGSIVSVGSASPVLSIVGNTDAYSVTVIPQGSTG